MVEQLAHLSRVEDNSVQEKINHKIFYHEKINHSIRLSCANVNSKKKSDDPSPLPTPGSAAPSDGARKKSLITAPIWKVRELTITGLQPKTPACDKDDTWLFKTSRDYVSDEGATRCNASDVKPTTDKCR